MSWRGRIVLAGGIVGVDMLIGGVGLPGNPHAA